MRLPQLFVQQMSVVYLLFALADVSTHLVIVDSKQVEKRFCFQGVFYLENKLHGLFF